MPNIPPLITHRPDDKALFVTVGDPALQPQLLSQSGNNVLLSGGGGSVDIASTTNVAANTLKLTKQTYTALSDETKTTGNTIVLEPTLAVRIQPKLEVGGTLEVQAIGGGFNSIDPTNGIYTTKDLQVDGVIKNASASAGLAGQVLTSGGPSANWYWAAGGGGGTPTLSQVLTAGNTTGASNISVNSGQSIDFAGGIDITGTTDGSINFTPSSRIDYASANTKISVVSDNISLDASGGGLIEMTSTGGIDIDATSMTIDGIPNATKTNALYYDSSTKAVSYGAAGVGSVSAGSNISITGTSTAPIVNLASPLTSSLNVGAQFITTSITNQDITLAPNGTGGVVIDLNNAGTSATPTLEMINATSGAGGVVVDFYHNSATPAVGDGLGVMSFYGKNSAGTKREFARIESAVANPNSGSEQAYVQISRLNGGSFGSSITFVNNDIQCANQNLTSVNTMTAQQVVCGNMRATNATYPKYDPNTFEIKNDGVVSAIPAPSFEGETFTGANGGRLPATWVNPIAGDITHTSYCVAEFQGYLFWGGYGYVVQTDYTGVFIQEWAVSGGTNEVFTLYVGDSGSNLYIGGSFTNIGGTTCNNIAYMNSSFGINAIIDAFADNGLNDAVYSIRPEPSSGGIVVGGAFTATGGGGSGPTTLWRVAEINISGSNTWGTWAQINDGIVFDTCRFNDGSSEILLVGGSFSSFDPSTPTTCAYIVGFNISTASYFAVGSSGGFSDFDASVRCFALQPASSQVYVAGDFTSIAFNPYLYSTYFNWTTGFQTPNNYDWTGGTGIYSIVYNPTDGNIYRGGSGVFSSNSLDLTGSAFTIGLNIRSINGILPYTSGLVYIPSAVGTPTYAYTYQPDSFVSWSSTTDIVSPSGTPYTAVSASGQGLTFTLKGSLTGGSTGPRWFIQANNGCTFS